MAEKMAGEQDTAQPAAEPAEAAMAAVNEDEVAAAPSAPPSAVEGVAAPVVDVPVAGTAADPVAAAVAAPADEAAEAADLAADAPDPEPGAQPPADAAPGEPQSMAELLASSEMSAEEAALTAGERPVRDAATAAEEARKAARRGRPRLRLDELVVGGDMRGKVVGVAEFGAFVDVGAVTDGLVHITELGQRRVHKVEDVLKQGDMVAVWVKEVDLEGGRVALSMRPRNLRSVETLTPGETLTGTVTSLTPYGAFVDIGADSEGMVHVSELSNKRVGKPEDVVHVGDEVTVWVKEVDPAAGRVALSMRSRDMKPIDSLVKGESYEGTVTSVTKYGAFIDVGAETEGLVHVSEMADHRVNRPEDVVKVGETVTVWVKEIDVPARRVSLSMRSRPSRPLSELAEGDVLEGTVSKVMDYGVFVNVGAETEGLVHVSEMGSGFIRNPRELVAAGDKIEVRVKEVDAGRKRISLTMIGLRNDLGGELPMADESDADEGEAYAPEPEERQPTVVELALRKAMGEAAAAKPPAKATPGQAKPAPDKGSQLSDVYSRMIEEYRQSKGD